MENESKKSTDHTVFLGKSEIPILVACLLTITSMGAIVFETGFSLVILSLALVSLLISLKPLINIKKAVRALEVQGADITDQCEGLKENLRRMTGLEGEIEGFKKDFDNAQEQLGDILEISSDIIGFTDVMTNIVENVSEISVVVGTDTKKSACELEQLIEKEFADTGKNVEEIQDTYSQLQSSIRNIRGFSDGITEIANKTNLLSLNAAIEAASAGDQGKGFAVVATEVKSLAEKSMEFVTNINEVVDQVENHATVVENEVGGLNQHFIVITTSITQLKEKLLKLSSLNDRVNDKVNEMETTTDEQVDKIEELVIKLADLRTSTKVTV